MKRYRIFARSPLEGVSGWVQLDKLGVVHFVNIRNATLFNQLDARKKIREFKRMGWDPVRQRRAKAGNINMETLYNGQ